MLEVNISIGAENDIKEIRYYTKKQWGTAQSIKYINAIRFKIDMLAKMPQLGVDRVSGLIGSVYSCVAENHIIYYEYDSYNLNIIAILHQSVASERHLSTISTRKL
jgi:plasmid stabilization system protein ParE